MGEALLEHNGGSVKVGPEGRGAQDRVTTHTSCHTSCLDLLRAHYLKVVTNAPSFQVNSMLSYLPTGSLPPPLQLQTKTDCSEQHAWWERASVSIFGQQGARGLGVESYIFESVTTSDELALVSVRELLRTATGPLENHCWPSILSVKLPVLLSTCVHKAPATCCCEL